MIAEIIQRLFRPTDENSRSAEQRVFVDYLIYILILE